MPRVLVTAAGSDIGIGAMQSLMKADHTVIAVDMNPHSAGLHMADVGTTVPPATHHHWPAVMAEVVRDHKVDVVVPLVDDELRELDRLQEALWDEIPILVPRIGLVQQTLDKYESYKLLSDMDFPVPETCLLSEMTHFSDDDFPRFIKPRFGHGSRGTHLAHSLEEANSFAEQSGYDRDQLIIQEFIKGIEYSSNVTVTRDNRLLSVVIKETPIKRGMTVWGITRKNPVLKESCVQIYEKLEPGGPMNVQQMLSDDGTPYVLEINPRFSGSSCLNVEAGVNEFDLLVRDAVGESVEPITEYDSGLGMIRYTNQIYIHERDVFEPYDY